MSRQPHCVLVRDPRFAAGGFETWVETLARGLPPLGVRVTLLVPGGGFEIAGTDALPIPVSGDPIEQAAHVVEALERLAGQGESGVFFTMAYDYINIAGLNLRGSPWCDVPVLHGRHPSLFDWIVAGPPRRIVVPSRDFARSVRRELRRRVRWFRAMGRVVIIPHGVEVPPIEAKLARPPATPLRVVAVTRLDEDAKRPLDLVRIALRAREWGVPMTMTIAGGGPAEASMRALSGDAVQFAGILSRDAVRSLLMDADVLVSTSESEAFGLSIAEALACGCAVVAADIEGPVRELVTEESGIRVPVGDIEAFVDALAQLAATNGMPVPSVAAGASPAPGRPEGASVRALGAAGQALIARRFSADRMLHAYADLIRGLTRHCHPNPDWRAPRPLLTSPSELTLPPLGARIRRTLGR